MEEEILDLQIEHCYAEYDVYSIASDIDYLISLMSFNNDTLNHIYNMINNLDTLFKGIDEENMMELRDYYNNALNDRDQSREVIASELNNRFMDYIYATSYKNKMTRKLKL